MPKITTVKSSEDDMSAVSHVLKATVTKTRKSRRIVSTAAIVAANTAGSSNRVTGKTKKDKASVARSLDKGIKGVQTVNVNKEAIQASVETLEERTMHKSWYDVLSPEFTKPYFKKVCISYFCGFISAYPTAVSFFQLKQFLIDESTANTVYPPSND
jgi:hypothetical protein